jgi:hypothetical protein
MSPGAERGQRNYSSQCELYIGAVGDSWGCMPAVRKAFQVTGIVFSGITAAVCCRLAACNRMAEGKSGFSLLHLFQRRAFFPRATVIVNGGRLGIGGRRLGRPQDHRVTQIFQHDFLHALGG